MENFERIMGGVLESPQNPKDHDINQYVASANFFEDNYMSVTRLSTKDQGYTPRCTGFGLSVGEEYTEELQNGKFIELNPNFTYAIRLEGQYQGDDGAVPVEILSNIVKIGMLPMSDFPLCGTMKEIQDAWNKAKGNLSKIAYQYRKSGYARLKTNDEIRTALKSSMKVYGVFQLYDTIHWDYNYWTLDMPTSLSKKSGKHFMNIQGWKTINGKLYWVCYSNWGVGVLDKGYMYIPFDYGVSECWSVSDSILPIDKNAPKKYYQLQLDKKTDNSFKLMDDLNIILQKTNYDPIVESDKDFKQYWLILGQFTDSNKADNALIAINKLKIKDKSGKLMKFKIDIK